MYISNTLSPVSVKRSTKENLRIAVLAWISIPILLGLDFLVDWLLHDWMAWVDWLVATVIIFGGLAYRVHAHLKQGKCLKVFLALLALHSVVFVHLLRSGVRIRTAWYVPIVFVEAFVFGLILTGPGGAWSEEDSEK
jgi:hypothetical protein